MTARNDSLALLLAVCALGTPSAAASHALVLGPAQLALAERATRPGPSAAPRSRSDNNNRRISLQLVDSDVRDALRLVAKQADVNLVLSRDVTGPITLELEDVSLDETLDAIARVGGLEYELEGSIVTVSTLEERVNRERQLREAEGEPEPAAEPEPPAREPLVVRLKYVDAERMLTVIEDLLGERGTVSILKTSDHVSQDYGLGTGGVNGGLQNGGLQSGGLQNGSLQNGGLQIGGQLTATTQGRPSRSHTLVVVDTPERLAEIEAVARRLDQKPRQVVIEARFVEVTLAENEDIGIDWNLAVGASGAASPHTFPFGSGSLGSFGPNAIGSSGGGIFPDAPNSVTTPSAAGLFTFGTLDFSQLTSVLQLIQGDSRVQVVSRPQVSVGDRQTATILVGERYPILSANISDFGSVTEQLDRYEPIGVQLEVSPSVLDSDQVELFVRPSSSSLGADVSGSTGLAVARINSRQIDTSVTVGDRETVVLGGLITTREVEIESRVPFLGSIPLLGQLFSRRSTETERVNLMVFLTVSIQQEAGLTEEQRELFERSSGGTGTRPASMLQGQRGALPLRLPGPRF